MANEHKILLKTTRDNYLDECFYGSYYLFKDNKIVLSYGLNPDTICFLRSLAKPIQLSTMCDYDFINLFNQKELAIFEASHAASPTHINFLKKIIKKHNIKISDFNLEKQEPLDKRKFNGIKTKLHNNCSGKHLFMLLFAKYLGLDLIDYQKPSHKIQKLIHKKQNDLSEYKSEILTYDGCSTPLWGIPIKNTLIAYNNLSKNHKILIDSALNNSYIYGGFDRLDSEIIKLSNKKLFAKVGAGGFLIVYNIEKDEFLLLKMAQNNNPYRKLVAFNMLNKLNWGKFEIEKNVYNQKNKAVANYEFTFDI